MSLGRYVIGCLALIAIVAPPAAASAGVRRLRWPALPPAAAHLVDITFALVWLAVESELLGSVGAFTRLGLIIASVASGALAGGWLRRTAAVPSRSELRSLPHADRAAGRSRPRPRIGRSHVVSASCAALVFFEQFQRTAMAMRGGVTEFDSLAYHLPIAAGWVQQGSLTRLHPLYPGALDDLYPFNAELLHAIGMLAFGRDILSEFINLGFVAMILLAAWSIGRSGRAGGLTVAVAAAVLATPQLAILGGGTALNDLAVLALLLTAIALVAAETSPGALDLPAALAGGWALGTKPEAAAVVVVAAAVLVVRSRERRLLRAGTWVAGLVVGGGYWYVRDLILVGTPLPGEHIGPLSGPRAFPFPLTFASALRDGTDSLGQLPGDLHATLGPWWPLIAVAAGFGLLVGLWRGHPQWQRAWAAGGLANLVIWPFTPFTEIVVFAVRYAAPGIMVGVTLFATYLGRWRGLRACLEGLFTVVTFVEAVRFASAHPGDRLASAAAGLAVGLGILAAGRVRATSSTSGRQFAGLVALGLVLFAPAGLHAMHDRYRAPAFAMTGAPDAGALTQVFEWAQQRHDIRLGLEGGELQYPLFGADLSNRINYLGRLGADGTFLRIRSCDAWRAAINATGDRYVMTVPWGSESNSVPQPSPQAEWTVSDPAAHLILSPGYGVEVFRISGPSPPCSAA